MCSSVVIDVITAARQVNPKVRQKLVVRIAAPTLAVGNAAAMPWSSVRTARTTAQWSLLENVWRGAA